PWDGIANVAAAGQLPGAERVIELTRKNRPAQRIGSDLGAQKLREVPVAKSWNRHRAGILPGIMVSVTLKVEEEECLVRLLVYARNVYRAPDRDTKLIAMRIRAREPAQVVEVVVRVEGAIAQVIVHIAVDLTGAGLCNDVDDVSCAPSILCSEGILLHLELLHVIRRWDVDNTAPALAGIPGTVEKKRRGTKVSAAKVKERDVLVGRALLS